MPASNRTTFDVGSLAITAAGTAEQLTAHRVPQGFYLTLHAHPDNTGKIYFGNTKAIAEAHLFTLEAGASAKVATDNVGDVWADCSVDGEIIEWLHETCNVDV